MSFREGLSNKSLLQILLLALTLGFTSSAAWAQDAVEEDEEAAAETEEAADLDKVVVTGSRLQRETYTSISPLQIITAEGSREAGLVDSAQILQSSSAAAGQQIDLSFSGFVLDNGPGASTVNLRGLGAGRTLVLLNGRRLAPSGVEGAPTAPDLNLIPGSLVQRYEVLLDGASSIYGSDAVAGVTNIIMKKDFDGFEFDVFYNQPEHDNGESYNANIAWGQNYDRGMIGIGVEYNKATEVQLDDRPWTEDCYRHHEITTNGDIRFQEQYWNTRYNFDYSDGCAPSGKAGYVIGPFWDVLYNTPGFSNGGWSDFSQSRIFLGSIGRWGLDTNADGVNDVDWQAYDLNGKPAQQAASLWPESERLSVMAYGEYTFEGDMNNTVYFEFNYNDRDFESNSAEGQLFPNIPANNPYNICNPNAEGGVDCGLAEDAMLTNPGYVAQFQDNVADYCALFGVSKEDCTPSLVLGLNGPYGPISVQPVVSVAGDRNLVSTSMEQLRAVIGINGDLPFVDWGSMNSWVYDVALSYTTSEGESSRPGIRGDRLDLALGWYSSTGTPCENDLGYSLAPRHFGRGTYSDTAAGCVPVNMFAASLYPMANGRTTGEFGSQAERDYLFDSRDFVTEYNQTLFTAYANGFLFNLPGGTAMGGLGIEYREDEIKSVPDEVAGEGLLWGFFADGGASGSKWTREAFGEIELPLLAGVTGAEELTLNMSGRYTDDEFYGDDFTYSVKLGWRPIPSLLLRGTFGTSFRAPNVREVFLVDQTGFGNVFDPCIVPLDARNPIDGSYIPDQDDRTDVVLQNCLNQGIDPTALDNNGIQTLSTEVAEGGSRDLEAETSESLTYGFAFEQPWFDAFDLTFGVTYWEIDIDDTIIDPSAQFLVNDCYNDPQFDSAFCSTINRDQEGFISIINAYFINRDNAFTSGYDYNLNYDQAFSIGSQAASLGIDLVVTQNEESSTTFINNDGDVDFDDDHGELYNPKWKGQMGIRLNISDFRFSWITNYIGKTYQDPDGVEDWSNIWQSPRGDTCFGPPEDVNCRNYFDTDEYWLHSTSLYWYGDTWTVGAGIRNVFDEEPPQVNGGWYTQVNNTPIGAGYDLFGRTYFLNVIWRP